MFSGSTTLYVISQRSSEASSEDLGNSIIAIQVKWCGNKMGTLLIIYVVDLHIIFAIPGFQHRPLSVFNYCILSIFYYLFSLFCPLKFLLTKGPHLRCLPLGTAVRC